ncbi:hypothetical protein QZH41_005370 [Actinostola sp. cb2023]|nr:hypothetical protein QZH41_005370 [Actinostola sp. cb2023]
MTKPDPFPSTLPYIYIKLLVASSYGVLSEDIGSEDIGLPVVEVKTPSGGGEVINVEYVDEETRLVFFEDPSVIERVVAREHVINNAKLKVVPHYSFLGETSANPEGGEKEKQLEVDPQTMVFIEKFFHQEFQNLLQENHMECTWQQGSGDVVLCSIDNTITQMQWEDSCIAIESYIDQIVTHEVVVSQATWREMATDYLEHSACYRDISRIHVFNEDVVITLKGKMLDVESLAEQLERLKKEKDEKFEFINARVTEQISLNKAQFELMSFIGFTDRLKSQFKDLEATMTRKPELAMILIGLEEEVRESTESVWRKLSHFKDKEMELPRSIVSVLSSEDGNVFLSNAFRRKKIGAVVSLQTNHETKLVVTALDQSNLNRAVALIKTATAEESISLDFGQKSILFAIFTWTQLMNSFQAESTLLKVTVNQESSMVQIAGVKENVREAKGKIETFLKENTAISKLIEAGGGSTKFVLNTKEHPNVQPGKIACEQKDEDDSSSDRLYVTFGTNVLVPLEYESKFTKVIDLTMAQYNILSFKGFAKTLKAQFKDLEATMRKSHLVIILKGPDKVVTEGMIAVWQTLSKLKDHEMELPSSIVTILASDAGNVFLSKELRNNQIDAVISSDANDETKLIVTAVDRRDVNKAMDLIKKVTAEDSVYLHPDQKRLIMSERWMQLLDNFKKSMLLKVSTELASSTVWIAGVKKEVVKAKSQIDAFFKENTTINKSVEADKGPTKQLPSLSLYKAQQLDDVSKEIAKKIEYEKAKMTKVIDLTKAQFDLLSFTGFVENLQAQFKDLEAKMLKKELSIHFRGPDQAIREGNIAVWQSLSKMKDHEIELPKSIVSIVTSIAGKVFLSKELRNNQIDAVISSDANDETKLIVTAVDRRDVNKAMDLIKKVTAEDSVYLHPDQKRLIMSERWMQLLDNFKKSMLLKVSTELASSTVWIAGVKKEVVKAKSQIDAFFKENTTINKSVEADKGPTKQLPSLSLYKAQQLDDVSKEIAKKIEYEKAKITKAIPLTKAQLDLLNFTGFVENLQAQFKDLEAKMLKKELSIHFRGPDQAIREGNIAVWQSLSKMKDHEIELPKSIVSIVTSIAGKVFLSKELRNNQIDAVISSDANDETKLIVTAVDRRDVNKAMDLIKKVTAEDSVYLHPDQKRLIMSERWMQLLDNFKKSMLLKVSTELASSTVWIAGVKKEVVKAKSQIDAFFKENTTINKSVEADKGPTKQLPSLSLYKAQQLDDVSKEIAKKIEYEKAKITKAIPLTKAQFDLLSFTGFVENLQAQFKDLEAKMLKKELSIHFRGPDQAIREGNIAVWQILSKMKDHEIKLPKSIVSIVTSIAGKAFLSKGLKNNQIDAVISSDANDETKLIVTAVDRRDVNKAMDLIEEVTAEDSVDLHPDQKRLIMSERWMQLLDNLKKSMLLKVSTELASSTVWIAGVKKEVVKAKSQIDAFFKENTTINKSVEADKGPTKQLPSLSLYKAQQLDDVSKEIAKKIEYEKAKITKAIPLTKAQFDLLSSMGFVENLQAQFKDLEAKMLKKELSIHFRGPDQAIREGNIAVWQSLSKMKDHEIELPKSIVSIVTSIAGKVFLSKELRNNQIDAVISSDANDETKLIVTAVDRRDVNKAMDLIKKVTAEDSVYLHPDQKRLIMSERWMQLLDNLKKSMLLKVSTELASSTVWIAGVKKEVVKAKSQIDAFFKENTTINKSVEADKGPTKQLPSLSLYKAQQLDDVSKEIAKKIEYEKAKITKAIPLTKAQFDLLSSMGFVENLQAQFKDLEAKMLKKELSIHFRGPDQAIREGNIAVWQSLSKMKDHEIELPKSIVSIVTSIAGKVFLSKELRNNQIDAVISSDANDETKLIVTAVDRRDVNKAMDLIKKVTAEDSVYLHPDQKRLIMSERWMQLLDNFKKSMLLKVSTELASSTVWIAGVKKEVVKAKSQIDAFFKENTTINKSVEADKGPTKQLPSLSLYKAQQLDDVSKEIAKKIEYEKAKITKAIPLTKAQLDLLNFTGFVENLQAQFKDLEAKMLKKELSIHFRGPDQAIREGNIAVWQTLSKMKDHEIELPKSIVSIVTSIAGKVFLSKELRNNQIDAVISSDANDETKLIVTAVDRRDVNKAMDLIKKVTAEDSVYLHPDQKRLIMSERWMQLLDNFKKSMLLKVSTELASSTVWIAGVKKEVVKAKSQIDAFFKENTTINKSVEADKGPTKQLPSLSLYKAQQLDDVSKEIAKKIEYEKAKITKVIDLTKAQFDLLSFTGFVENLQAQFKDLEAKMLKKELSIHFRGPDQAIREGNIAVWQSLSKMKDHEIELPKSIVSIVTSIAGKVFLSKELRNNQIDAVISSDANDETKLIVTAVDRRDVNKAMDLIEEVTAEDSVDLHPDQKRLIMSERWMQLLDNLKKSMLLKVSTELASSTVWIAGVKKEVVKAKSQIDAFFKENTTINKSVEADKGPTKQLPSLSLYKAQQLDDVSKEIAKKIEYEKAKITKAIPLTKAQLDLLNFTGFVENLQAQFKDLEAKMLKKELSIHFRGPDQAIREGNIAVWQTLSKMKDDEIELPKSIAQFDLLSFTGFVENLQAQFKDLEAKMLKKELSIHFRGPDQAIREGNIAVWQSLSKMKDHEIELPKSIVSIVTSIAGKVFLSKELRNNQIDAVISSDANDETKLIVTAVDRRDVNKAMDLIKKVTAEDSVDLHPDQKSDGQANNTIVNNLGKCLVHRFRLLVGGEIVQDTNRYDLIQTYQDLFKKKSDRENMLIEENKLIKTVTDASVVIGIAAAVGYVGKKTMKESFINDPSSSLQNYGLRFVWLRSLLSKNLTLESSKNLTLGSIPISGDFEVRLMQVSGIGERIGDWEEGNGTGKRGLGRGDWEEGIGKGEIGKRGLGIGKGDWEEGIGKRGLGRGDWEEGIGKRGLGRGDWEEGMGKRRLGRGDWEEAIGKRGLGRDDWEEGIGKRGWGRGDWEEGIGKGRLGRGDWEEEIGKRGLGRGNREEAIGKRGL